MQPGLVVAGADLKAGQGNGHAAHVSSVQLCRQHFCHGGIFTLEGAICSEAVQQEMVTFYRAYRVQAPFNLARPSWRPCVAACSWLGNSPTPISENASAASPTPTSYSSAIQPRPQHLLVISRQDDRQIRQSCPSGGGAHLPPHLQLLHRGRRRYRTNGGACHPQLSCQMSARVTRLPRVPASRRLSHRKARPRRCRSGCRSPAQHSRAAVDSSKASGAPQRCWR